MSQRSATAKRSFALPPAAVKVLVWTCIVLAYVAWFWPVIFSSMIGRGGAWIGPAEMVQAAGVPALARKLWIAGGITLAIPVVMLLLSLYRPRKLHGDAKFGGEQDARKAGLRAPQGIVLGIFKRRPLIASAPGHAFVAMPPGGGKSSAICVPTLLQWRGSVITLDTKKELWKLTAGFRSKFCDCYLFDPLNEAGETHRYNPLDTLGVDVSRRINQVRKTSEMLIALPTSGDPYWANAARDLLSGVILALADRLDAWKASPEGPAPLLTLGEVYRSVLGENIQSSCKKLAEYTRTELGYKLLMDFATMAQKQADGVKGMVVSVLSLWGIPSIDQATSVSDFSFVGLRKKATSIYLGTAPSDLPRLQPLFSLVTQQVLDALCSEMPRDDEPFEVLQLLDEFAQLGRMETLSRGLDFLRGYNCRIVAIVQAPSQLDVHYGREGRKILIQNCRLRILGAPNDPEVARELSEELGYATVRSKSRTMSSGKTSTTVSDAKRALLLPQEVRELSREDLLVLAEGTRPLRVRKGWYFEDPGQVRRSEFPPPALPGRVIQVRMRVAAADEATSAAELARRQDAFVEAKADELLARYTEAAAADPSPDSDVAKSLRRRAEREQAQANLDADAAAAAALLLESTDG